MKRRREWSVDARDKPALLWAVLSAFVDQARISLEGDLQQFGFLDRADASLQETKVLRRITSNPVRDFVVLPVTADVVLSLKSALGRADVFTPMGALEHVLVECQGNLVYAATDNFEQGFTGVWEPLDEVFLERLRSSGVVRSYTAA